MAAESVVRARIDTDVKIHAASVLKQMGLSVSDLIRVTLARVAAEERIPFEIRVPNAVTVAAIERIEAGDTVSFDSIDDLFADLNKED